VLAESEVQFQVFAEADEAGPEADYAGPEPEDGWYTVTVRVTWWSPSKRVHEAEASLGCCALTETRTAESVAREYQLRGEALGALNEKLREMFLETHAIRQYLERDVYEVHSGDSLEAVYPTEEQALAYAVVLREELAARSVAVVAVSPKGKLVELLEPVCYACDAVPAGTRDRRPEGGRLEVACARHAERLAPARIEQDEREWDDATMGGVDRFRGPR